MNKESDITLSPAKFSNFGGSINLEKSKSIANRALILQKLSRNAFTIDELGNSDDVRIMQKALNSKAEEVNCGLAGTVLRFLCSVYALTPGFKILKGEGALKTRPIKPLIDALIKLGADINYLEEEGYLPIRIQGKELDGGDLEISQDISSQFVSSLMMIGPFLKKGLIISRLGERKSESYIELTKNVMTDLSLEVSILDEKITVLPAHTFSKKYVVEADWSAAVYWMAFVCLLPNSKVTLKGLFPNSKQGDKALLSILDHFGLEYKWLDEDLFLSSKQKKLTSFNCDCSSFPDQAQTLAFLCVAARIDCSLSGLETLIHKETNRIEAIRNEVKKLGVRSSYSNGELKLSKPLVKESVSVETYNDHRMAMAASLLGVEYNVKILNPEVVSKSYPNFWEDLELLTT